MLVVDAGWCCKAIFLSLMIFSFSFSLGDGQIPDTCRRPELRETARYRLRYFTEMSLIVVKPRTTNQVEPV